MGKVLSGDLEVQSDDVRTKGLQVSAQVPSNKTRGPRNQDTLT
jgi:hypothetical protein